MNGQTLVKMQRSPQTSAQQKPSRGWLCFGRASNTWSRSATSGSGGSFLANQTHRRTEKLASLSLTARVLQLQQATGTQLALGLTSPCKLHVIDGITEAYPLSPTCTCTSHTVVAGRGDRLVALAKESLETVARTL